MKRKKSIIFILLLISIISILYITIFSRERSLSRNLYTVLFWTYRQWIGGMKSRGESILLNIALFVPFGYLFSCLFMTSTGKKKRIIVLTVLTGLAFSLIIEVIQYYTGRGTADVDDLFNNTAGSLIGVLLFSFIHIINWRLLYTVIPMALIFACLLGCWRMRNMTAGGSDYTRQFWFEIESVTPKSLSGSCYTYDRFTPDYTILLQGDYRSYRTETVIDGDYFTATAEFPSDEELKVLVKFDGMDLVTTNTLIVDGKDLYVQDEPPMPVDNPILSNAVLKAYSAGYDTYIYEKDRQLIWLIGYDIASTTEIIYHIHTNEVEKLPESRQQYEFDNRSFRTPAGATGDGDEVMISQYRMFIRPIPTEYNVTSIVVGFNPGGGVVWRECFRPAHAH